MREVGVGASLVAGDSNLDVVCDVEDARDAMGSLLRGHTLGVVAHRTRQGDDPLAHLDTNVCLLDSGIPPELAEDVLLELRVGLRDRTGHVLTPFRSGLPAPYAPVEMRNHDHAGGSWERNRMVLRPTHSGSVGRPQGVQSSPPPARYTRRGRVGGKLAPILDRALDAYRVPRSHRFPV